MGGGETRKRRGKRRASEEMLREIEKLYEVSNRRGEGDSKQKKMKGEEDREESEQARFGNGSI